MEQNRKHLLSPPSPPFQIKKKERKRERNIPSLLLSPFRFISEPIRKGKRNYEEFPSPLSSSLSGGGN